MFQEPCVTVTLEDWDSSNEKNNRKLKCVAVHKT